MWSLLMRDFKILPFSTNCKVNVKRTNICEAISFLLKSLVLKWSPKSIKFYLFTRSSDVFIYLFFLLLETSSKEWCFLFPICIFASTMGGLFSWMHAKLVLCGLEVIWGRASAAATIRILEYRGWEYMEYIYGFHIMEYKI